MYYRKLTDVTVKEDVAAKEDSAKAGATVDDDDDDAVKIFDPKLEDEALAKGVCLKRLLDVRVVLLPMILTLRLAGNKPLLADIKKEVEAVAARRGLTKTSSSGALASNSAETNSASHMVMYNGAMLDIASMLQRLDKSEKLKLETDAKLKDIEEEMGECFESARPSQTQLF